MLEIKNSKPIKEDERIRFRCMRCTACCRHVKGSVVVDGLDAYRLARYLKMKTADFISQYTDPFILADNLWYPIFSLRTVGDDEACVFLKGSRCTVQEAKPRTCRLYPFWVEPNEPDGASFTYHICFEHQHHPKGSLVRVKDWMKENFGEEDRESLKEDFQTLRILTPLLYEARQRGVDGETIFKKFLLHRYLFFTTNEPYLPQQQRNNRTLIDDFKSMVHPEKLLRNGRQKQEESHAHT